MMESENPSINSRRIRRAYETAKAALLAEMVSEPVAADDPVQKLLDAPISEMRHWVGELSTSALSTATAVMALEQMRRQYVSAGRDVPEQWLALIRGGIEWLVAHQNEDGGWGDTVKSLSNISTTMLCHAVLKAVDGRWSMVDRQNNAVAINHRPSTIDRAADYIDVTGGVKAVIARYGKDRTFSVPILTHCALAGLVDWDEVISLPFELACIPAKFYAAVRLPVVSYALPALIAIGQVRFHFRPSRNPLRRWLQRWAKPASLRVLERIQPSNGGFLEATPLTSFVTMSLAAMGLHDHPVAQRGIEFIVTSAREELRVASCELLVEGKPDAANSPLATRHSQLFSWPIDTNLATWVTTLAINALGDDVPLDARPGLRAWLLRQQYRVVHPYTNAAPGGWAWTDLPGGVPDADDTPGAMLALIKLDCDVPPARTGEPGSVSSRTIDEHVRGLTPSGSPNIRTIDGPSLDTDSLNAATRWLVNLQNRDGGWPTFCRGWGTLPFDRSSPDISAHAIRALADWQREICGWPNLLVESRRAVLDMNWTPDERSELDPRIRFHIRALHSLWKGIEFLKRTQRPDGSWLPLWFGNQHAPNDENPTYGTAKVLAAFQALGRMSDESAVRGVRWLVENQNPDGGWGAGPGTPSSIEETALALEALLGAEETGKRRAENEELGMKSSTSQSSFSVLGSSLPGCLDRGLSWLIPRVEDGRFREASPIGFYFAKLWYFEALYPLIFTVAALRKAAAMRGNDTAEKPANDGK